MEDLKTLTLKSILREGDFAKVAKTISEILKEDPRIKYMLEHIMNPKECIFHKSEDNIFRHVLEKEIPDWSPGISGSSTVRSFFAKGYFIEIEHFDPAGVRKEDLEHVVMYAYVGNDESKAHRIQTKEMTVLCTYKCLDRSWDRSKNVKEKITEVFAIVDAIKTLIN